MLTLGNRKLGDKLIHGFGLPSGRPGTCPHATPTCLEHCYDRRVEAVRPSMVRRREDNLRRSKRADFPAVMQALILALHVRLLRVHVGGDFYSAGYAGKWLRVMKACPDVRFWWYSRSWKDPAVAAVFVKMAALPNVRGWYSVDRDTGRPEEVPPGVKLAWLMTTADDEPPYPVDLVFRVRGLRREARTRVRGARVCPDEDGVQRKAVVTCDRCLLCFKPTERQGLIPLPVLA
jgi:hypothetical protein